jgi:hypothetical protein
MDAGNGAYHSPQSPWIAHKLDAQLHSRSVCSWMSMRMCVHRLMKEMQEDLQLVQRAQRGFGPPPASPGTRARAPPPPGRPLRVLLVPGGDCLCY